MRPSVVVRAAARSLIEVALDPQRDRIDLEALLAEEFEREGESQLRSAELAEEWIDRMHAEVESVLREWSGIGVPPPAVHHSGVRCLTFRHQRYPELAPLGGLPADYPAWLALVENADPREFTLAVCAWLRSAGCTEIYVIDGANDFGVDCFGVIPEGPLRSVCILCQAKTASAAISAATVRGDYQKFLEDFWDSPIAAKCIRATSLNRSLEGFAAPYVFLASSEFESRCSEYAGRHRLLLRDPRQIAYSLSGAFSLAEFAALLRARAPEVRRNFDFNWAPVISPHS